ncbi:MAG: DUF421 domain-containing protein [Chitinophagaceae bacterium]|nr:MAG: DUF421 domain-containing protein [Chitinophagaceae bacterium]
MEFLNEFWGIRENIAPLELAARAAVMFLVSLLLLRVSGMRPFGRENTFDTVITFLIGGILSRGVVGATPFFSCIAGAIAILLLNRGLALLTSRGPWLEHLIKGGHLPLYRNGQFLPANMRRVSVTEKDIREQLRVQCQEDSFDGIAAAFVEKSGKISFVRKRGSDA